MNFGSGLSGETDRAKDVDVFDLGPMTKTKVNEDAARRGAADGVLSDPSKPEGLM